jgi:alkaline phosphatase D
MAIEVTDEGGAEPVAVEFVNTSLTSQNLDDKMEWEPLTRSLRFAHEFVEGMPHVHWVDFDSHGYTLVDITPERVLAEWWAVGDIVQRDDTERLVASWGVRAGSARLVPGAELELTPAT